VDIHVLLYKIKIGLTDFFNFADILKILTLQISWVLNKDFFFSKRWA